MIPEINANELSYRSAELRAGDRIYLSGEVYTARDAAHKRITEMLRKGAALPFPVRGSVIYYAGPTPAKPGRAIGSCGPTTSSRMDKYAPELYDLGLAATIGKGPRSAEVIDAIVRNGAVYLAALGGIGALAAKKIVSARTVAFDDLGCESVKLLTFDRFPLYVGIDCRGDTMF